MVKKSSPRYLLKIKYFLFLGSLAFFILFVPHGVDGSSPLGFSADPQIFELDLFPGEKTSKVIELKNLSDMPLPILVKITDFTAQEDTGEMEFEEYLNDPIIASSKWFKIEKPNFIMEKSRKVNFEISVPEDAEPGGHYSVILFEPQLPSFYFEPGQPKTVPVIGVIFLISVKNLSLEPISYDKPVEIVEFKIPDSEKMRGLEKTLASMLEVVPGVSAEKMNIVERDPSSFFLRIKNNDIFHQKISGKIMVYNFFGKKVGETEVKKTTILPDKVRQFPVDVSKEIPESLKWMPASVSDFLLHNTSLGKYRVVLELKSDKNSLEFNDNLYFWALPWKFLIILLISAAIFIIIRRRLPAAIKAFFKPDDISQSSLK